MGGGEVLRRVRRAATSACVGRCEKSRETGGVLAH